MKVPENSGNKKNNLYATGQNIGYNTMSIEYVCLSKPYSEISCLHSLNFIPLPELTQVTDLCAMNTKQSVLRAERVYLFIYLLQEQSEWNHHGN